MVAKATTSNYKRHMREEKTWMYQTDPMQIRTQPKNQIYMSFCGFCYLCSPRDAFDSSASRRVSSPNFWVSMVQIDLAALYLIYSPDWPVEPGLNEGHSLPFRIQLVISSSGSIVHIRGLWGDLVPIACWYDWRIPYRGIYWHWAHERAASTLVKSCLCQSVHTWMN